MTNFAVIAFVFGHCWGDKSKIHGPNCMLGRILFRTAEICFGRRDTTAIEGRSCCRDHSEQWGDPFLSRGDLCVVLFCGI